MKYLKELKNNNALRIKKRITAIAESPLLRCTSRSELRLYVGLHFQQIFGLILVQEMPYALLDIPLYLQNI
jgi:hypothetical protein